MSVPYGTFRAAITPPLKWSTVAGFDASAYQWLDQFSDVQYAHALSDGRTASVALSMHDPLVTDLRPYEQALLLMYVRPNVDPDQGERIFWGQCNVVDDYEAATVTLNGQDPSIRLQHQYIRVGDVALNNPRYDNKGRVSADDRGIKLIVDASYYGHGTIHPNAPIIGLATRGRMNNSPELQSIERGQELWEIITTISESAGGPDFDLKPNHNAGGALPSGAVSEEGRCYAVMHIYNPPDTELTGTGGTVELARDKHAEVIFEYGQPQDNVSRITVTPEHPTNDVILVDNAQSARSRAQYGDGINQAGLFQDWVSQEIRTGWDTYAVLEQYAMAHLQVYGHPGMGIDAELRPDTGQDFFYGDPESPASSVVGDFYIGDRITFRAVRGNRSFEGVYRITQVELTMNGSRGPITTKLTLMPQPPGIDDFAVNTEATVSVQEH